jgi:histidine triad (HIT) family protein
MTTASSPDCLVCAEVDGTVDIPGGYVYADDLVVAFHRPPLDEHDVFAGHLLVVPRRHARGFADLDRVEAASVGIAMQALCEALERVGASRVYSTTIGHHVDHLHVHLLPRWPGTPADVAWHAVDDWPGARRVDGVGTTELCEALRRAVRDQGPLTR